jgi:hypothetical protein
VQSEELNEDEKSMMYLIYSTGAYNGGEWNGGFPNPGYKERD